MNKRTDEALGGRVLSSSLERMCVTWPFRGPCGVLNKSGLPMFQVISRTLAEGAQF